MQIAVSPGGRLPIERFPHEIVERKGLGHPDTLADGLAEAVSVAYSRYCLEQFGRIANHWVDKCMVVGGESAISFGDGRLVRPYQVVVVGKMTTAVGNHRVPAEDLAEKAVHDYLGRILHGFDPHQHVRVKLMINNAVGAGRPDRWYRPSSPDDLPQVHDLTANDAAACSAHAPMSRTERLVLELERAVNGGELGTKFPETGTDVKVLAVRSGGRVDVTACVPFLADLTPSRSSYDSRKAELADQMARYATAVSPDLAVTVRLNTRDDAETVYLTSLGSAADTGDVGVVGRGNRANGLITPMRPMSIEASAGKNPVYHTGKLYAVLSQRIADELATATSHEVHVHLTSSTGRPLDEPESVVVELIGTVDAEVDRWRPEVVASVRRRLADVAELPADFVRGATLW